MEKKAEKRLIDLVGKELADLILCEIAIFKMTSNSEVLKECRCPNGIGQMVPVNIKIKEKRNGSMVIKIHRDGNIWNRMTVKILFPEIFVLEDDRMTDSIKNAEYRN